MLIWLVPNTLGVSIFYKSMCVCCFLIITDTFCYSEKTATFWNCCAYCLTCYLTVSVNTLVFIMSTLSLLCTLVFGCLICCSLLFCIIICFFCPLYNLECVLERTAIGMFQRQSILFHVPSRIMFLFFLLVTVLVEKWNYSCCQITAKVNLRTHF